MIQWNDRRKAKKAASATMKTTLGMMAKTGALKGTTRPSTEPFAKAREKQDSRYEREDVKKSAESMLSESRYHESIGGKEATSRGQAYKDAAHLYDFKNRNGKK
jgi:hypothetical protein